ncbi:MAG: transporter associated domain-containing protein [Thermodesulfobacteriota bacterium]
MGGYITENAGHVPQKGDVFTINGYNFQVKEADSKQIFWLLVHQAQSEDQDENP